MSIKNITTNELRRMKGREGIIFPGCGGDLNDWLNGINATFNEEGLFLDGTKFTDCYVFKDDRVHCLLFPFDDSVKLDMGKLAKWRIAAHDRFYGTWLSDYVDSRLGGFVDEEEAASDSEERQKPDCPLIGADSNVFVQIGIAARTLRHNGLSGQASEMTTRAYFPSMTLKPPMKMRTRTWTRTSLTSLSLSMTSADGRCENGTCNVHRRSDPRRRCGDHHHVLSPDQPHKRIPARSRKVQETTE